MAKIINGVLYVPEFTATGNDGEYTFENAIFNNQADSGNGAYDIILGFVIYVPVSDKNTFTIIPGITNRYVVTAVTVIDPMTVSGTILWDGDGVEIYAPTNGITSIISEATSNLKLGIPVIDTNYPEVAPGTTIAALLSDAVKIVDKLQANSTNPVESLRVENYSFTNALSCTIEYDANLVPVCETITDADGCRVIAGTRIINNTIEITFTEEETCSVNVIFRVIPQP